jgi:hypothetical protein
MAVHMPWMTACVEVVDYYFDAGVVCQFDTQGEREWGKELTCRCMRRQMGWSLCRILGGSLHLEWERRGLSISLGLFGLRMFGC